MEIIEDESYEDFGIEFQYETIKILNAVLKKHKIPIESRKEICGDFIFNFSMLIDQGEIEDTVPMITFYEEDKLYMKNEAFEFHEYAYGNISEFFDNGEV